MDLTPEQIARKYGGMEFIPGDERVSVQGGLLPLIMLARAYLALTAPLRGPCNGCRGTGLCGFGSPGFGPCLTCSGSGSVLTEYGKRMEAIESRWSKVSLPGVGWPEMPAHGPEDFAWLLSRLTAALNEIERLKLESKRPIPTCARCGCVEVGGIENIRLGCHCSCHA